MSNSLNYYFEDFEPISLGSLTLANLASLTDGVFCPVDYGFSRGATDQAGYRVVYNSPSVTGCPYQSLSLEECKESDTHRWRLLLGGSATFGFFRPSSPRVNTPLVSIFMEQAGETVSAMTQSPEPLPFQEQEVIWGGSSLFLTHAIKKFRSQLHQIKMPESL